MRRPKYLTDQDLVQDALTELRQATLKQLAAHTNLTYAAVQQACLRLSNRCLINRDRIEGKLVFLPTYASLEEREAVPQHGYLIRKYGMYYRPYSAGYTSVLAEAGFYSLDDAIKITHPNGPTGPRDGMAYVHRDEAP